ncbi:MAG: polyribonucleotide nucleotidyltransferase [Candidatus Jorgensenbacteria bacterium]|nr:polyribonucleotide nucleotidyltransferase [Candidatus Jorgensenbacteria bacterium]
MNLNRKKFETVLGDAKLQVEVSELAHQANSAVLVSHGDTVVLAATVMGHKETSLDYFPLTVDFEERFYAVGKILGSRFVRRENRPTENAILSGRLIDRTIRPLFDQRLRREVQVILTIISYDGIHSPDVVALFAASVALGISDIPWGGPVAGVRTSVTESADGKTYASFFAGTESFINMIELEGKEVSEKVATDVFVSSQETIKQLVSFQKNIITEIGKKKQDVLEPETTPAVKELFTRFLDGKLEGALKNDTLYPLKEELFEYLKTTENAEAALRHGEHIFETVVDEFVHTYALKEGKRVDGRGFDEVRDLYAEVHMFERLHGSAVFMRGDTQVFAATTLGSPADEQLTEDISGVTKKRFMLHYNFPSFSTGETGRSRGPGRREIGHGALAHKAISQVIPDKEEFPYTIRVVAETLSSNGSSSQATICSTSLSLMDAGVPIKKPVAGIAIGLMTGEDGNYKILTDIQGPEDHYGDMDFKVAGTDAGVLAIQMDVKIGGISKEIFIEALKAGEKARMTILSVMNKTLSASRESVSKYAPLILKISIHPSQIGLVIGPGGKMINGIIADCGGDISIDIDEDGTVFVSGADSAMVKKALSTVQALVHEYSVGDVVTGPIIKLLEFGAIVDLGGGQDGMIHVSELKDGFVKKVEDVVHLGEVVTAKIVRSENGKIGLSLKALAPKQEEPKQ